MAGTGAKAGAEGTAQKVGCGQDSRGKLGKVAAKAKAKEEAFEGTGLRHGHGEHWISWNEARQCFHVGSRNMHFGGAKTLAEADGDLASVRGAGVGG